jgi:hypothetical protein
MTPPLNKRKDDELDETAWRLYLKCVRPVVRSMRFISRLLAHAVHRLNLLSGELLFVPRPGDLYIASYPRSGTTWLQMIVYHLMTNGDMSFDHISAVIPFFERSLSKGQKFRKVRLSTFT